jgi:hypothetical protein
MKQIRIAIIMAIIAILIITIVFIFIISPLKGLGILTPFSIFLGISIWGFSLILLISGLKYRNKENISKVRILITIVLIIAFIPVGYLFMKISGKARTRITVAIVNHSGQKPTNIKIYGIGNIFENADTLKLGMLNQGESMIFTIQAISKPHRSGHIKMEFDINNKHISKNIAGRFSINPYEIKQEWNVTIDNSFFE